MTTQINFDVNELGRAAEAAGYQLASHIRDNNLIFSLVDDMSGWVKNTRELSIQQAADFIEKYKAKIEKENEYQYYLDSLPNCEVASAPSMDEYFDHDTEYDCETCHKETTMLNVGRLHYAVCHKCKSYRSIGSNLFTSWRDEDPEVWEQNKKLLSIYRDDSQKTVKRPPLGSLGDCLEETAKHEPLGYLRLLGCNESFWHDIPAESDKPWIVAEGVTACLELAPVSIFITKCTDAATAVSMLQKAIEFIQTNASSLHDATPVRPEPEPGDLDDVPF